MRASYASVRRWPTWPPSDCCSNVPIHRRDTLTEQLQTALNSRILIEQAKGVLAERLHVDVADTFALLRNGARSRNRRRLSELAQAIVDGSDQMPPADLDIGRAGRPGRLCARNAATLRRFAVSGPLIRCLERYLPWGSPGGFGLVEMTAPGVPCGVARRRCTVRLSTID